MSRKTKSYRCLRALESHQGVHEAGERIELEPIDGDALVALGSAELVTDSADEAGPDAAAKAKRKA